MKEHLISVGKDLVASERLSAPHRHISDLAQIEFLERGGPARDRLGLDPDGDGYACAWDPTPFRKASQG